MNKVADAIRKHSLPVVVAAVIGAMGHNMIDSGELSAEYDSAVPTADAQVICVNGVPVCAPVQPLVTPTPQSTAIQPTPTPGSTARPTQPTPTQIPPEATPLPLTPVPTSALNLLRNPGFEPPFVLLAQRKIVANQWQYFECEGCPALRRDTRSPARQGYNEPTDIMHGPEFVPAAFKGTAGREWKFGANAQQWFCMFFGCDAGVYQTVGVQPGATCTASAWVRSWSSNDGDLLSDLRTADDIANSSWYIRVDGLGESDWRADRVLVSPRFEGSYDTWSEIKFTFNVPMNSSRITVFFENTRLWGFGNNDSYIDGASLRCTGS